MMGFKKHGCVILVLILLISLCSCSELTGETDSGSSSVNSAGTEPAISAEDPVEPGSSEDEYSGSTTKMYTAAIVNVYSEKSVDSRIVDALDPGTAVHVIEKETKWSSIRLNGKTCFVLSVYLKAENEAGSGKDGSHGNRKDETAVIDPGDQAGENPDPEPVGPGSSETEAKASSGTGGTVSGQLSGKDSQRNSGWTR